MKPATYVEGFSIEEEVAKMPYQLMGNTGLQISKLSIGSAPFGGEKIYGTYSAQEAEETVITAIRKGINFIDSGPLYGEGVAETFLGSVLKRVPRKAYYISTKVGRPGVHHFDFSRDAVVDSLENSLRRLQLDYVDIVFVHDVEFAKSPDVIINETLPQLEQLVKSGKAKFIGLSAYPLGPLLEIVENSKITIDCILSYSRDTLIDDTLQKFLPKFEENGVGVINASCIGMKLLSNMGPPFWHPATKEIRDICRDAAEYCEEKGIELGNLALYHALNQPGSSTCLIGVNDRKTLLSNMDILRNGIGEKGKDALRYIQKCYFTPDKKLHWEGIEIALFREKKFI